MAIDLTPDPATQTQRLLEDTEAGVIHTMVAAFNNAQMLVWSNPYGLTPQEVFDLMGSDAVQNATLSAGMAQLINGSGVLENGQPIQVVGLMPAGVTMQANEDGTITVVSQ